MAFLWLLGVSKEAYERSEWDTCGSLGGNPGHGAGAGGVPTVRWAERRAVGTCLWAFLRSFGLREVA